MLDHFRMFADYNRWANARLYDACAGLTDVEYRADKGAFFGSAHRTLNHILVADRIWMKRLTGVGPEPVPLDTVLYDAFPELRAAREDMDGRIVDWLDGAEERDIVRTVTYGPSGSSVTFTQPVGPVLAHVFNHQPHHRGQVHVILTALGKPSLVLDLVQFLRTDGARWATV